MFTEILLVARAHQRNSFEHRTLAPLRAQTRFASLTTAAAPPLYLQPARRANCPMPRRPARISRVSVFEHTLLPVPGGGLGRLPTDSHSGKPPKPSLPDSTPAEQCFIYYYYLT